MVIQPAVQPGRTVCYNAAMPSAPPPDHVATLTGLRGLAAVWVLLLHLWLLAGAPTLHAFGMDVTAPFATGYLGVDLFFVLSGFLLARPFLRWIDGLGTFPDLRTYIKRRALRVLPAFYVQLAILLVGARLVHGAWPVDAVQLLAYLSMQFWLHPAMGPLLSGVWWTLPVEWNFYLLLPLLAWVLSRARAWLVVAAVLLWVVSFRLAAYESLFSGMLVFGIPTDLYGAGMINQIVGRFDQFLAGLLAAWAMLRLGDRASRFATPVLLLGLVAMVAMVLDLYWNGSVIERGRVPLLFWHHTLTGAALALVVFGAAAGARIGQMLFGGRVVGFLGAISYSLYLWHAVVFQVAHDTGFVHWPVAAGMGRLALWLVPVVVLVSWVSYRCVERPFVELAHR